MKRIAPKYERENRHLFPSAQNQFFSKNGISHSKTTKPFFSQNNFINVSTTSADIVQRKPSKKTKIKRLKRKIRKLKKKVKKLEDKWEFEKAEKLERKIKKYKRRIKKLRSYKGTWPPANPTPPSTSWPAKVLSGTLLKEVVLKSYLKHNMNRSYLNNAFSGGPDPKDSRTWPQTLWKAVDRIGKKLFMKAIFKVSTRLQSYPSLWKNVKRIKHCWDTTSYGYAFSTLGRTKKLQSELEKSPKFCRDFPLSEYIYHDSQDCYREITPGGSEGLHVCLGKGMSPNIHIDSTQPAVGKNLFGYCKYSLSALWDHGKDISKDDN